MSPIFVRIMSWFLSAALFSIAIAGLFLNSNSVIDVEQLNVESQGGVLGGNSSTPVPATTTAAFTGSVYAFHLLLDSEIEEENYKIALDLAKELPESSQRALAIEAILKRMQTITNTNIEKVGAQGFGEESNTVNSSIVQELLKVGNSFINLLPDNEHKSAYLSRFGLLRAKAEDLDLVTAEWDEVPTPEAARKQAEQIAIETYKKEVSLTSSSSSTFFASMGLATNKVIKFVFLALVAGFIGAIGEQYACHKKIKSILKTDTEQSEKG